MPPAPRHAPPAARPPSSFKLGRRRPVAKGPRLHLARYLPKALPPLPTACDYSVDPDAAPVLRDLLLNDQYGDCVIAAGYHVLGALTGNAEDGSAFHATADQIVADYSAIGGFDPNNPDVTDNGCDEQTAFNYWTQHGFADGSKLVAWLSVDGTRPDQVRAALYLFENLFFGIALPDAWITPFPQADGFVWDAGPPNPQNGHAVCGVGYTARGVTIDTWGLFGTITDRAIARLCSQEGGGELYVLLSAEQLAKGQAKAPNGFDWATLVADFDALGGKVPVPAPAPGPGPGPAPAPAAVTLANATAWAQEGLISLPGRFRVRAKKDVAAALTKRWPK